jgi:hypothetical protein
VPVVLKSGSLNLLEPSGPVQACNGIVLPLPNSSIQVEIKSSFKSGNACYYLVKNLLSSSLLSKNLKIKLYRTIILPVLYGGETWSLTLREERRLRVFETRLLRKIFGTKRDEVTGEWRKPYEELNDLFSPNIGWVIKLRMRWAGHVAHIEGEESYTGFWWRNLRERDHLQDPGVDGRIKLRWIFRKWDVGAWTGLSWLRIGTGRRYL